MFAVLIRLIELIASSVVLSSAMMGLWSVEIIPSKYMWYGIIFFIEMIIFIIIQILCLRKSFFESESRREYVIYNLMAYFIFAVVSMGTRIVLGATVHTWTFGIYKFMMYANADMTWWQSAIYGHLIMVAIIFLAPIGAPSARDYRIAAELGEDEFGNPLPDTDFDGELDGENINGMQNAFEDPFRNLPDEIMPVGEAGEYLDDDDLDE